MRARVRLLVLAAVVGLVMALPAVALARSIPTVMNPIFVGRTLYGIDSASDRFEYLDVSGDFVVYAASRNEPDGSLLLRLRNLVTGSEIATWYSDPGYDTNAPRISGSWVAWYQGGQIRAKNVKTGALVSVPTVAGVDNSWPTISGNYIVWQANQIGIDWDVKGWNLATHAPFTVAGSDDIDEYAATVYGKRVSYLDDEGGLRNLRVATIGSSATPSLLATDAWYPTIGEHLVVWASSNAAGKKAIFYHDFETGGTYTGPSSDVYDLRDLKVAGDRITYTMSNGVDDDIFVFDTMLARAQGVENASFPIAATMANESLANTSGNQIVYLSDGRPMWGTLVTPSVSLNAVPTRIPHLGHIHLVGSISELGRRLGGVSIRIEKYASGKWTSIKTLTTTASGTFSYQTSHNHSKTSYRVVYAGNSAFFDAGLLTHLSAVSSVRVAWPR